MNYFIHEEDSTSPGYGIFRLSEGFEGRTLKEFGFERTNKTARDIAYHRCKSWQEGHAAATAEMGGMF